MAGKKPLYEEEGGKVWEVKGGFRIEITGGGGTTSLRVGHNGGVVDESGAPVRDADLTAVNIYLTAARLRGKVAAKLYAARR
jgi:hypothetical protein